MKGPPPPSPPLPCLHGTKESNNSKKRQRQPPAASARRQNPTSSAPELPQQQQRDVVIIQIDEPPVYQAANPQEFKELVQRLTGMSPGPARAKEVPTAASTAPKAVQSSGSDSSNAALEETIKWMMKEDDPKFKIGQSSSRIFSPTPLSPAQKPVQSSANGSHAALEKIKRIMEEEDPEFEIGLSSSRILSPTPTTLRQISPQDCFFPDSDKKAVLQGISGQFPPPSPSQIAPQDSFFFGSDTNAVLKRNSGQLPRPPQPQEPLPMPQIAPVTPPPIIAYHSSTANNSLPSIVPSLTSLSPITAQYKLPQQIQGPPSVPSNCSSSTSMTTETYNCSLEIQQKSVPKNLEGSMWPVTEAEVDRILASFEQIEGPPSVPSNSFLSPINEHSNLPQGLSVPYRSSWMSTTTSPEIQQTSVPDNLAGSMWPVTEDEVERILARFEQTQGPPNVVSNSSLSPINEHYDSPQGLRVAHRSLSTSTTAQTSVPDNLEAMWPVTQDEVDRMLAGFDFEHREPFPRLPTP